MPILEREHSHHPITCPSCGVGAVWIEGFSKPKLDSPSLVEIILFIPLAITSLAILVLVLMFLITLIPTF